VAKDKSTLQLDEPVGVVLGDKGGLAPHPVLIRWESLLLVFLGFEDIGPEAGGDEGSEDGADGVGECTVRE
jgi:hypothetical protein